MASKSTMVCVFFGFGFFFSVLFSFENRLLTSLIISSYLVFFFFSFLKAVRFNSQVTNAQKPVTLNQIQYFLCFFS